ncbi:DUF1353 domain-containing protein [Pseudomonas sp. DSP3-2-2]|uniref:DUF1353 domain-containing protein n=1 Tax=unclassified Pseudomonas TaxID=196821 RepID=UPI003CFA2FCA
MSQFLTTLKTEQRGKWNHRLLADLVLDDDQHGRLLVEIGFETNFASLQVLHNVVLFPLYALVAGYGNYAATIHDKLYTSGQLSRKDADDVLYRALRAEGVAKWRAWIFWAGVRLGGSSHYATSGSGR